MRTYSYDEEIDLWEVLEDCDFYDEADRLIDGPLPFQYSVTVNVTGTYRPARIFCPAELAHPEEFPEAEAEKRGDEYAYEAMSLLEIHMTLGPLSRAEFLRVATRRFDLELDNLCCRALEDDAEPHDID